MITNNANQETKTKVTEATNNIINQAFKAWADQWWFKILFCTIILSLLFLFVQIGISKGVTKSMREWENTTKMEHTMSFQNSRQTYALGKKIMQESLKKINCDYIFLLEYHNGSENIVTGLQFCKFDLTLEVTREGIDMTPKDKFKDDIVARYNILLSDEMNGNKIVVKTMDEMKLIDKYLYYQLSSIGARYFAIINLTSIDGQIYASLCCVSLGETMNKYEIVQCARELEGVLNQQKISKKSPIKNKY